MAPGALRLVSFLKAETFERGEHIIKEGEAMASRRVRLTLWRLSNNFVNSRGPRKRHS